MMVRGMRWVGGLVVGHPGLVTALSLVVTLLLYANIHNLRTGTDLTDLRMHRAGVDRAFRHGCLRLARAEVFLGIGGKFAAAAGRAEMKGFAVVVEAMF